MRVESQPKSKFQGPKANDCIDVSVIQRARVEKVARRQRAHSPFYKGGKAQKAENLADNLKPIKTY
jgi:hypothetical protein